MSAVGLPAAPPLDGFAPEAVDVDALEASHQRALEAGSHGSLPIVGYGEISLVLGWPPERPTVAVKGLPVIADRGRVDAYADLISEYAETLRGRGTAVVPSAVRVARARGGWRGYLLQPLLPAGTVGSTVLGRGGAAAWALLEGVADRVFATIDDRVGLDAQVSNWALLDGRPCYLDIGTPMLRDGRGRERLDVDILVTSVPWALRPAVARRVAPGLLRPYYDHRATVLDTAGNLIRERLPGWIGPLLDLANPRLDRPLTAAEVRRFYRWNARMYASLQLLRRADRAWQLRVRRRPYPFLLPEHYDR